LPELRFIPDANTIINHLNKKIDIDKFLSEQPEHTSFISFVAFIEVAHDSIGVRYETKFIHIAPKG
jgi:hypothetical protein